MNASLRGWGSSHYPSPTVEGETEAQCLGPVHSGHSNAQPGLTRALPVFTQAPAFRFELWAAPWKVPLLPSPRRPQEILRFLTERQIRANKFCLKEGGPCETVHPSRRSAWRPPTGHSLWGPQPSPSAKEPQPPLRPLRSLGPSTETRPALATLRTQTAHYSSSLDLTSHRPSSLHMELRPPPSDLEPACPSLALTWHMLPFT